MLSRPNDILAIEYLKALRRQRAPMEPLAVQRQGAGHDGAPSGDTASASYLRTLLRSGRTDEALSYLPAPAAQVLRRELALGQAPADLSYCQRAILARLRQLREEDFSSPLLGKAYALLFRRARDGLSTQLPLLAGELTGEEMDHLAYVAGQPESLANSRRSLADYIAVIRGEALKRSGVSGDDLLLAAQQKNFQKKAYMEETP